MLLSLPFGFYLSLAVLAAVAVCAWKHRKEGWGIPAMAVCGTVFVWYHGDVVYNDFSEYSKQFSFTAMNAAWLQVAIFLLSLAWIAPVLHRVVNRKLVGRTSTIMELLSKRDAVVRLRRTIEMVFGPLALVWVGLSLIALVRTDFDWRGLFAPWLGHLANPWARGRLGGGVDFLLSAASIVNAFCMAGFGVVAALAQSRRIQIAAIGLMVISWPLILFDRTRNAMLAAVLPGLLCLVFVRLRARRAAQVGVLVAGFLTTSSWFAFVMAHRSTETIAGAFAANKFHEAGAAKHEGLNMFEELCWINKFLEEGTYRPNWGHRYFAEAVNMVPRTIWSNKPSVGLDYSIVRMQGSGHMDEQTVTATVSTGMIGQGVVNFGSWAGPPAAALLMSLWVALLARFDLAGERFGRLLLYVLGIVLTYNLGRDITLLVAYPIFFGYGVIWIFEKALRGQRSEVGGRRSEVRDRRSEVRMKIAVLFDNFGPYHIARLTAASRDCGLLGIEVARRSLEYAWIPTPDAPGLQRGTLLLEQATSAGADPSLLAMRLDHVLTSFRPKVVAIPGWSSRVAILALRWCVQKRVPAVVMSESQVIDEPRNPLKEWVKRRCVRAFSAALAGGRSHRDYLVQLGMPGDRVFLGYDAIDNAHFFQGAASVESPAERLAASLPSPVLGRGDPIIPHPAASQTASDALRRELGLPEHYFLASNRFIPKKNLPFLLRAYARYRRERTRHAPRGDTPTRSVSEASSLTLRVSGNTPGDGLHEERTRHAPRGEFNHHAERGEYVWDLVILGDGPLRAEIESLIAELGLEGHVFLPGFRQYEELPAYYGLAGAFVHASTSEQWGLVVNEAMAAGLPVLVSSRCGCAAELVCHGRNGFQFDPHDEAALAGLMARLAGDETARAAMGQCSRELINCWGPDRFARGLHDAAECALSQGPAPQRWLDDLVVRFLCGVR